MVVEQEVSAAARNGSAEDAAARLREVEPMVRAICRRRLGEADGDDAAQRALLTIWRTLESERGVDFLPTYAATCARYETLAAYRGFQRTPTPAGDMSEQLWADADPGPAEQAERVDEIAHARERVEALLAQLTPRQADVMRATVLADRDTAEAAELLGIIPSSVRTAQVRAMARLRELSGTRSPNPLALNRTTEERAQLEAQAHRARVAAHAADAEPADPMTDARAAVEALVDARGGMVDDVGDSAVDPMDRARTAVEGLQAAVDEPQSVAGQIGRYDPVDAVDQADEATADAGAA